jgi:ABC-type thiamine transport system substrate-binding protein
MKRILFCLLTLALLTASCGDREQEKKVEIMYAVEYTVEFKDGPKKIIEIVNMPAEEPVGLFYIENAEKEINRLVLKGNQGFDRKEICSTRFRISSYGINNWRRIEQ